MIPPATITTTYQCWSPFDASFLPYVAAEFRFTLKASRVAAILILHRIMRPSPKLKRHHHPRPEVGKLLGPEPGDACSLMQSRTNSIV
jgi:hypothetical protein